MGGSDRELPSPASSVAQDSFNRSFTWAQEHAVDSRRAEAIPSQQVQTLQQSDVVQEGELELHDAIVDEWGRDIGNLAQDIRSLHGAMVDLAHAANSQGEVLDDIERNMERSAEAASGATEQLVQASVTQRRGNKMIYCMLVFAAILSIIIVVVVILRHS